MIKSKTKISERDYWQTPVWLINQLEKMLSVNFVLDPCATIDCSKGCFFLDEEQNGLKTNWQKHIFHQLNCEFVFNPAVFVNPPFSKLDEWIDKIIEESAGGLCVALLHPDSSDTKWYQKIEEHCFMQLVPNSRINFLKPGQDKESSGVSFHSVISVFNALPKTNVQRIRFNLEKGL